MSYPNLEASIQLNPLLEAKIGLGSIMGCLGTGFLVSLRELEEIGLLSYPKTGSRACVLSKTGSRPCVLSKNWKPALCLTKNWKPGFCLIQNWKPGLCLIQNWKLGLCLEHIP